MFRSSEDRCRLRTSHDAVDSPGFTDPKRLSSCCAGCFAIGGVPAATSSVRRDRSASLAMACCRLRHMELDARSRGLTIRPACGRDAGLVKGQCLACRDEWDERMRRGSLRETEPEPRSCAKKRATACTEAPTMTSAAFDRHGSGSWMHQFVYPLIQTLYFVTFV